MYAANLISYSVPPLTPIDNGEKALMWMNDFHIRHLPVVENGMFLGLLSEDEVLNLTHPQKALREVQPSLTKPAVYATQHLYDIMKLIVDFNLTVIPVLNKEGGYLGVITIETLVKFLAETGSITHPGGVIVLEMKPIDYSLAEIARIIESEKVSILSSFISSPYGKSTMELTLKLNKQDLKYIVATLERFDYSVKYSFFESDYLDSLQDRYDSLMRYLNV